MFTYSSALDHYSPCPQCGRPVHFSESAQRAHRRECPGRTEKPQDGNDPVAAVKTTARPPRVTAGKRRGVPNALELRFVADVLGVPVETLRYEGLTFRLANGDRYTPDWVDMVAKAVYEVKGPHRFARHGRERFYRAKSEWGDVVRFVYAAWDGRIWKVEG